MRYSIFAAAVATAIGGAAVADASVTYHYFDTAASFSYTASDFITSNTTVSGSSTTSCTVFGVSCTSINFSFLGGNATISANGSIPFIFGSIPVSDSATFSASDLLTPGTHVAISLSNPLAALTVTRIGGAVPEPASWAMMLAGFGLVGSAMRRRHNLAVSFA